MKINTEIHGELLEEDIKNIIVKYLLNNGYSNIKLHFDVGVIPDPTDRFGQCPSVYGLKGASFTADKN